MHGERPEIRSDAAEDERLKRNRREALEILIDARDRLVSQLCDEILSNREAILETSDDGLYGFEFQEIEERYTARLHALNSILENLEYRRPRIAHRVETLSTTRENLAADIKAVIERYDQWDLVDIEVTTLPESELLVVVGFTADEYID